MNIAVILIILLVGAIATCLSGNKFASKVAILFGAAAAIFSIALLVQFTGSGELVYSTMWISDLNISFSLRADGLSMAMLLMTTVILSLILISSVSDKMKNEKYFYSLVMLTAFSIAGVFLSSNALVYYVFWELSLIPIYFITIYWGSGEMAIRRKATMTFFIYTFAGSMFMLAAIIYLYTKVGSLELMDMYNADLSATEQTWIYLAFFLAYAIKIPIFPFHTWQADVYERSPYVGTMLLGGLMSKMGLYSVLRWQLPIVPDAAKELQTIVLILCVIGVIYGSIVALKQDNIKRLFAYASLAHVGFVAAGAYSGNYDGLEGAVFLMIAHGFGVVGLFFAAEIIQRRWGTLSIKRMGGIQSLAPRFATLFFVVVLVSITLPLTLNFLGEFTIMLGLYELSIWYMIGVGVSMFMGAFFMLQMYQHVMLGEVKNTKPFWDLTSSESFVFVCIGLIAFVLGIYSIPMSELISGSLTEILSFINR